MCSLFRLSLFQFIHIAATAFGRPAASSSCMHLVDKIARGSISCQRFRPRSAFRQSCRLFRLESATNESLVPAMSNRSSSRKSTAPDKPARGSGVQRVYEALRRAIVELDLPPGSPLDEVSLSQQFALSRTPVREALVRLAADGLVLTLPNRNTIVETIEFAKLHDYFEALALMYRVPPRSAALRRSAADITSIRAPQAAYAAA